MIEIDGSYKEGGGALLRVSTALSAVTGKPFHIQNIRAGRPNPGIMMQHLSTVHVIQDICHAHVDGLKNGSTELKFKSQSLDGGNFMVDVGTAGSVSLILLAFIIPAIFSQKPVEISLKGGTDVRWSPTIDYIRKVTIPTLKLMGVDVDVKLEKRGYYPRGGGVVFACINPVKQLKPLNIHKTHIDSIKGISYSNKLPSHVANRQAESAREALRNSGHDVDIKINVDVGSETSSPGSGLVLWTEFDDGKCPRLGSSSLGKPGRRAEIVGKQAACELLSTISKDAALDKYMADQIIPYLAISGSSSVKIAELTNHTLTNIYAAQKFTGKEFKIKGNLGEIAEISVN